MQDNVFVEDEYECLWAVTVEYITGSVRLVFTFDNGYGIAFIATWINVTLEVYITSVSLMAGSLPTPSKNSMAW